MLILPVTLAKSELREATMNTNDAQAEKPNESIDHDALFKELLLTFFSEFIELFLPDLHQHIDPNSLSPMGTEIFAPVGNEPQLKADVLMRVNFKAEADKSKKKRKLSLKKMIQKRVPKYIKRDGEVWRETFFIIHVEPQSYSQTEFHWRMFAYFANLLLLKRVPVYSIALFSYDSPLKRAKSNLVVKFPNGKKILDFRFEPIQLNRMDWHDYLNRPNPVASALMAKMKVAPEERPLVKSECIKMLLGLDLVPAKRDFVAGFIDTYLKLNAAEQQVYQEEIKDLAPEQEQKYMQIVTSWGEKAYVQGQADLLLIQISFRFGQLPSEMEAKIKLLTQEQLSRLTLAIFDFKTQEDLAQWLAQNAPAVTPEVASN
jgi:Domain of unknown function (DUF4351)